MKIYGWLLLAMTSSLSPILAQGTQADYDRAASLDKRVANKVFRDRVTPQWLENGAFWYRVNVAPDKYEFVFVNDKGQRKAAFDHDKLAQALSNKLNQRITPQNLPFNSIKIAPDGSWVRFRAGGKTWQFDGNELKESNEVVSEGALTASGRIRPSNRTGEETEIHFMNRTANEVSLFWSDTGGQLQPYGTLKPQETKRQHTFAGHIWVVKDKEKLLGVFEAHENQTEAIIDGKPVSQPQNERRSPNSNNNRVNNRAFIRDYNVWLREGDKETQLTNGGSKENAYTSLILWSLDGSKFVVRQAKSAQERKVHIVESSPADQLQPKLKTIDYLKPGDQIEIVRPRLFDAKNQKEIPISDALFSNPWSITNLAWDKDNSAFSFLYNQRGHQVMRFLRVDAETGKVTPIIEETSPNFIDYSQKTYLHLLEKTNEVLWASERDGYNHLYLFDAQSGKLKNQITRGNWMVREVEKVDEEKRQLLLRVMGVVPGQDPYYEHLARVNFDGSDFKILTEGDGTHRWQFSPDGKTFIDTFSRVDSPPVINLRDAQSGALICELEKADVSELLKTGWKLPEHFTAKGRDGQTDIYGIIIQPSNFDATKKYPVIEAIYAGPQDYFTPKSFSTLTGLQKLAELGFIVVKMDGMGTNWRGKKFHDVAWKNLKDAGFPDRIAWIKAAAQMRPWMDLNRVGIYGGSAGGQNALGALLFHGDFYIAAAADCGCHDNRMDKIWWNEAWMGWPVGPEYADNSNVTHAKNLQGKLLLTVGELDTNVDPASTMQVADALVKAGKDFELIVFPGAGHGAGESPYGQRRRMDFFVRSLWGVEPRR